MRESGQERARYVLQVSVEWPDVRAGIEVPYAKTSAEFRANRQEAIVKATKA